MKEQYLHLPRMCKFPHLVILILLSQSEHAHEAEIKCCNVSIYAFRKKWMTIFVLHALHNPYLVLNAGWRDPLKHNFTHIRAEIDHFTLQFSDCLNSFLKIPLRRV